MNREDLKSDLILSREIPKTLAWYSLGALCVTLAILCAIYLPPVFKGLAHSAEANARQSEDVTGNLANATGRFDSIAKKIEERIDPILDNAEAATLSFKNGAGAAEKKLPIILDNLGATAARGGGMLGEGQGLLADLRNNTLPALNRPLGTIDSILVDAKPNIINATASLAHGMQRLDAYISDEKTVNWINEQMDLGHKLLLRIDDVAGSAVVMASNGEKITAKGVEIMTQGSRLATDVTDFVDGYLKAKPKWYQRFILTPLKAVLGYGLSVWEITKK